MDDRRWMMDLNQEARPDVKDKASAFRRPSSTRGIGYNNGMDSSLAHFLVAPAGQHWLAVAAALPPGPTHHLANLARLRRDLPPEQAGAVLEQAGLRRQGAAKFARAEAMLFTAAGLQQATGEIVA